MMNQFDLTGKTALVTGCDSGIGMGMATALAEAGADIVAMSYSIDPAGSEIETVVTGLGRTFKAYQCDFSDRKALYASIAAIQAECAPIDILVNNAGTILREPIAEHRDEYWDKVLEVNLTAQFILTREIGKTMVARGGGKVIFTASLLSFQGGITVPGYAASKSGVSRLAMSFANEWAKSGVNVNAIAPGYIATANTTALRADETRNRQILERIPANRWGTPDDFKGPVLFLASDASSYMNGHTMVVDGGWMGR
ncbi:MAG: SDR family oxidoreductase [Phycisphaerales bacterium]|nr:SDR family oxidoreductase [Phycisphaerales bacterium]MBT7171705.1 SDR family oxidoreductase [Phycisphaerales bacterium]